MQFLTDQFDQGLQYRTVNTLRSAISMTHPDVDNQPVGSHPLLSRLLKGMFNARPPAPRYSISWDVSTVIDYLGTCPTDSLSVLALARKLATLMALTNADRCSDLAALDRDYLRVTPSGVEFTVVRLTKTRTAGPPRTACYPAFTDNAEVCPVATLHSYISKTACLVGSLDHPRPLFITSRKPTRRARPGTLGRWIKDTLKQAGIDTDTFSAHSTRGSSTSYAHTKGVPINEILKVANWSSRSTFERFYHRPSDNTTFGRAILQSSENSRYIIYVCM